MIHGDRMGSGGWMDALLQALQHAPGLELAVCCVAPGLPVRTFTQDGVSYFSRAMPRSSRRRLTMYREDDDRNQDLVLAICRRVIDEFKPDLIHIHGTERVYGLLSTSSLPCPALISIQGLVSVYATWMNTYGNYTLPQVLRFHSLLQTLRGFGPLWDFRRLQSQGRRENSIIANNRFFSGRTCWDRSHIIAINPKARYFVVNELLRPDFSQHSWSLRSMRRHSLFFANGRGPRRNLECLLRAAALLLPKYPGLRLRIGGTTGDEDPYSRGVAALARRLGLHSYVDFLGVLPAERVAEELRSAHVFVLPSRIENSANSLCEAQLMGVPSIAGYTGGTPSIIEHGKTGMLIPSDDESVFASTIQDIFEDDLLALSLSQQGSLVAHNRHNCQHVRGEVLHAYASILDEVATLP